MMMCISTGNFELCIATLSSIDVPILFSNITQYVASKIHFSSLYRQIQVKDTHNFVQFKQTS